MFLILAHHYVYLNASSILNVPMGPARFIMHFFLVGAGKVGVVIFFAITAWFLLDGSHSLRKNCRSAWILDRQVLFYSVVITAVSGLLGSGGGTSLAKSFLPLSLSVWWYPTCYVLFLLIEPLIYAGISTIGREKHLALCVMILIVYGGLAFIPDAFDVTHTPLLFVFIYVLMAAYKWYFRPAPVKALGALVVAGYVLAVPYFVLACIKGSVGFHILGMGLSIPTLCVGFGVFLLFQRIHFNSAFVNCLASCSFGVYLISEHPLVREFLWHRFFTLDVVASWGPLLLMSFVALVVLYLVLSAIDGLRQGLFVLTIDRHKGWLFNYVWDSLVERRIKPGLAAIITKYGRREA